MTDTTACKYDQPAPVMTPGSTKVLDATLLALRMSGSGLKLLTDLTNRAEVGFARYGTYLMTDNGRDALSDLYQELLDAIMYASQVEIERPGTVGMVGFGDLIAITEHVKNAIDK